MAGKIYLGGESYQMNFPRAIGRVLASIGYSDKQEVFYIVDERSGDVTITRDAAKAIKRSTPRGWYENGPITSEFLIKRGVLNIS